MKKSIFDEIIEAAIRGRDQRPEFNAKEDRTLRPDEVKALRLLLGELEKACKYESDALGVFAKARLLDLPIPLRMWGQGHKLI